MLPEAQPYAGAAVGTEAARARRTGLAERALTYRVGAWLTGLIALSAALRFALASWVPAPWIFADELTYSELGKSFAASGSFAVRDVPGLGVGPLYPLLIAPVYALFENVPHAYVVIKAVNALVMSAAAAPAYFLARRLVGRSWALLVAGLTLAVPSMAYTGMVMTESLFYPLFLAAALGMTRVLERPSVGRQLASLGLIALALLTRPQAVALVPALLTAMVIISVADAVEAGRLRMSSGLRRLVAFWPTWLTLAAGFGALAVWESAHGRSLFAIFGNGEGLWRESYSPATVARWFLYHIAELDLYAGILPFAAFVALTITAFRRGDRSLRIFAAVSTSISLWLLLVVSAFVSGLSKYDAAHTVSHVEDRYTFYLVPLFLIALAAWLSQRLPLSAGTTVVLGLGAGLLPLALPYGRFIRNDAIPDTFALMAWATPRGELLVAVPHATARIALAGLFLGALFFLLRPPRLPWLIPVIVLVQFLVILVGAQIRVHGASAVAAQGIGPNRTWIDEAIGSKRIAIAIWSGRGDPHLIWENEFFNRSVGSVYYLRKPTWQGLPEQRLEADTAGRLHPEGSRDALRARFVLTDSSLLLRGRVIAVDQASRMRLYRIAGGAAGPVRLRRQ